MAVCVGKFKCSVKIPPNLYKEGSGEVLTHFTRLRIATLMSLLCIQSSVFSVICSGVNHCALISSVFSYLTVLASRLRMRASGSSQPSIQPSETSWTHCRLFWVLLSAQPMFNPEIISGNHLRWFLCYNHWNDILKANKHAWRNQVTHISSFDGQWVSSWSLW